MIRYSLQCAKGHGFEAWFASSAAFDGQAAAGIVACPDCGNRSVRKAIMAPHVGTGGGGREVEPAPQPEAADAPAPVPSGPSGPPVMTVSSKLREALHEMKRYVEANADYVGGKFADEARKIHSGDAEERSIYGETTDAEAEALEDEGVPFGRIPWPKSSDA